MNPIVPVVAKILAILTVVTDAVIMLYLFVPWIRKQSATIAPYARVLAFVGALVSMSGSLFYSEVAKYSPCLLCWWQRIFMYPQTFLIALGIIKNDKNIADYSIGLSAIGGGIALYHYYIQLGGKTFFSCEQVGYSASCTQRFTLEFGYISIPMMALTAFIAILLLMMISKRSR
jgi:hypothetical protein